MIEETVEPQEEVVEEIVQQQASEEAVEQDEPEVAQESRTQVPLSALQKERKKRQELELELQWERQRQQQAVSAPPPQEDNSKYESATREDLSRSQEEAIRIIEERLWIKNNPERFEMVNENLPKFLKQRPNLVSAISSASNRYEEAFTLMEALTPREQKQFKAPSPKKEAPGSPGGVPKSTAMTQAVDVMGMSDSEFSAWRQSQKKRR